LDDRALVGGGEATIALVDDQPLGRLAALEVVVEDLDDVRRLRRLGEERRRVVLGLVGELRGNGRQHRDGDDPDAEHNPLGATAGDE
jgi:hypothetical protein